MQRKDLYMCVLLWRVTVTVEMRTIADKACVGVVNYKQWGGGWDYGGWDGVGGRGATGDLLICLHFFNPIKRGGYVIRTPWPVGGLHETSRRFIEPSSVDFKGSNFKFSKSIHGYLLKYLLHRE